MEGQREGIGDPFILDVVEQRHLDINIRNMEHLFQEYIQDNFNKQQQNSLVRRWRKFWD